MRLLTFSDTFQTTEYLISVTTIKPQYLYVYSVYMNMYHFQALDHRYEYKMGSITTIQAD